MNIKKNEIDNLSKLYEKECIDIASKIWANPEEAFKEFYAVKTIRENLKKHKFSFNNTLDMSTAISASFGPKSAKKNIAILGEYDALYGTSLLENKDQFGHGCGHNLLGSGSLLSAIILSKLIKKYKLNIQITYYGCPAEEKGAGKALMVQNNYFDNIDACFTWHPAPKNAITNDIWIGSKIIQINFIGQESHASMNKEIGINANNLMVKFINYLNTINSQNISYIINPTLQNLSLTPKHASMKIAIRAFKDKEIEDVSNILEEFLHKNYSENEYKFILKERYPTTYHDEALQEIVFSAFKLFAPDMVFNNDEIQIARNSLNKISKEEQLISLSSMNIPHSWYDQVFNTTILHSNKIEYIHTPTDVGAVSKIIPTIQFQAICIPLGISPHTKEVTAFANTSIGYKGMILAAKIIASSILKYTNFME